MPDHASSRPPERWHRRASVLALAALLVVSTALLGNIRDDDPESVTEEPARLAAIAPAAPPVAPPAPAPVASAPAAEAEAAWTRQTVASGDNLSLIFQRAGFNDGDLYHVISEPREGQALARIFPGQTIEFHTDADGELAGVRHVRSRLESVTYRRTEDGFVSEVTLRTPEVRQAWTTGVIDSSLFLAGQEAGLSHNTIMQLANLFGGVIDFVLDPRRGDTIHVVYEDLYLDGEKYADGEIIAASFTNQGRTFSAYRYEDANGDVGYFDADGVSMRKPFLLAPVDFTRISSNFNLRRLHPIYKTTRPHRGTDYAAPRGTPVYAAGDGRVVEAGYSRANGNYVFIKHGEQYITKYLHLHKRRVSRGQRVQQSQVIGTVGATGAATGPHLHYEFLVNGVHRDPRTIHKQLPPARSLDANEMGRFLAAIGKTTNRLAALRANDQYAMSDSLDTGTARN